MPSDSIKVSGVDIKEVVEEVEDVMEGLYDSVTVQKFNNMYRVKVDGSRRSVPVKETESGVEVVIDFDDYGLERSLEKQFKGPAKPGGSGEGTSTRATTPTDPEVGEVHKPFSHDKAGYVAPGSSSFDTSHETCKTCAHYDNDGRCRIVDDIHPEGYCTEFYADIGIFMHEHEDSIEKNLLLMGEEFDMDAEDVVDIKEEIERVLTGYTE